MSDTKNIYAAFVKAQQEFAPALKSSSNPHFKSKYADLAACVEAVIDALNNHGIGLVQRPIPDERGVTIETVFVHESGEEMNGGRMSVPASKQDPQGYGSAATYARRYGLMAACGIAPEDDDGNAASQPAKQQAPAKQAAPKPPAAGPGLSEESMEAVTVTMVEADDIASLQKTFGDAYKKANSAQQVALKKTYDEVKTILTTGATA
jgi:hypothetical protein